MVSKLFKSDAVSLVTSQTDSIKEFCVSKILPRKLACCRKRRKLIAMDSARTALEKEVDVIRLIKSRRFVHLALKHLLGPALRKELKQRSKLHEVVMEKEE